MTDQKELPWHAAFPEPRNQNPAAVDKETLLQRLTRGQQAGKDFLLVDLRRNDHEGGTIKGSLNLPAQTLYPSLAALAEICKNASVKEVIFYCGSSQGRGTRAAGWFGDVLADLGTTDIESLILKGGIKGWAIGGQEYTYWMDGLDPAYWEQFRK